MPMWDWKKGMYGLQQPFTVRTPNGVVFDLTGYTVTVFVWDAAGAEFNIVGVLDADPSTGICYFTPPITSFTVAGKFRFEIEITKAGAVVKTKDYIVEVTEGRV